MTIETLAGFQTRFAHGLIQAGHSPPPFGAGYTIHARNVRNSLTAALEQTFPVVLQLVGRAFFAQMATRFITAHPPQRGWLTAYGAALPDFLEREAAASVPYLADISRLEWARVRATFSDDAPVLDAQMLARLPGQLLLEQRIALHPSASLLRSSHPIYSIWRAHQVRDAESQLAQISLDSGEQVLVAGLEAGEATVIHLPPDAGVFIAVLLEGQPLGIAWEAALGSSPQFDLAATLAELVAAQALAALAP